MQRRAWGFWSLHKLDILGDYVSAFNVASKRAGKTVYLDLFAGTAENESRDTGELVMGSARRRARRGATLHAVCTSSIFRPRPARLMAALRAGYPSRDFCVIPGDSNTELPQALDDIRAADLAWAPAFAFLDPDNLGIKWSTLEALADFKRGRKYKVELWILCFSSAMPRVLSTRDEPDAVGAQLLTDFFGTEQWREIHRARAADAIDPGQAREEYVNLLRWRLQNVLGYKHTLAFDVKNVRGTLYHLVFATDNDTGFDIMQDLYVKAAREHEPMRREAHERERQRKEGERGIQSLFSPEEISTGPVPAVEYQHDQPWPPLRLRIVLGIDVIYEHLVSANSGVATRHGRAPYASRGPEMTSSGPPCAPSGRRPCADPRSSPRSVEELAEPAERSWRDVVSPKSEIGLLGRHRRSHPGGPVGLEESRVDAVPDSVARLVEDANRHLDASVGGICSVRQPSGEGS